MVRGRCEGWRVGEASISRVCSTEARIWNTRPIRNTEPTAAIGMVALRPNRASTTVAAVSDPNTVPMTERSTKWPPTVAPRVMPRPNMASIQGTVESGSPVISVAMGEM